MRIASLTVLAAVWVVGACTGASTSGSNGSSQRPPFVPPSVEPAASASGPIDLPASILDPVVAEVARLAGVPLDQVTVISAEAVTFPDGSLGCPVSGMFYTQALVDGYKVVAEAGGATYDFRGTGSTFRRCEQAPG